MSTRAYFTREQAAEEMQVSLSTIVRAINAGRLRAKRTGEGGGGKYLISAQDLREFFDGLVDA